MQFPYEFNFRATGVPYVKLPLSVATSSYMDCLFLSRNS
jgi:hypothetical protein